MSLRSWIYSLMILSVTNSCEPIVHSESKEDSSSKKYRTIIYFQNGSDTEPQADLEIRRNDSLVFSGTVAYNNIPDDWHTVSLLSQDTVQRISVLHKSSAVRLDTTVLISDTLTHVFLTYSYHKLAKEDSVRFKKNAHDSEEEAYIFKLFNKPKQFSVLVMSGRISIP
jgi:hypothetical protein